MKFFGGMLVVLGLVFVPICAQNITDLASVETFSLGSACTAYFSPETAAYNPAAATSIKRAFFASSFGSFYDNMYSVAGFLAGMPLGPDSACLFRLPLKMISGIPETIDNSGQAQQVGTFSDIETLASLTFAKRIHGTDWGISAIWGYESLQNATASQLTLDGGVQTSLLNHLRWGASIRNIEIIPKTWSTGLQEHAVPSFQTGFMYTGIATLSLMLDGTYSSTDQCQVGGGVKWQVARTLSIQAGWNTGMGIRLGTTLTLGDMQLNYAFASNDQLGTIHKVGLSVSI